MQNLPEIRFHSKFIAIEGIDGSGKSTQARMLCEYLKQTGRSVLPTRDPGATPAGEDIRRILLTTEERSIRNAVTQALLFTAARNDNLQTNILPFIEKGGIVVMDRFLTSTLAMQGYASRIMNPDEPDPLAYIETLVDMIRDRPAVTIFLEIDPEAAMERFRTRTGQASDIFERQGLEYHQSVSRHMSENVSRFSKLVIRVNARQSSNDVHNDIVKELKKIKIIE